MGEEAVPLLDSSREDDVILEFAPVEESDKEDPWMDNSDEEEMDPPEMLIFPNPPVDEVVDPETEIPTMFADIETAPVEEIYPIGNP